MSGGGAARAARLRGSLVDGLYGAGWSAVRTLPEPAARALGRTVADAAWRRRGKGVLRLESNLARVVPDADAAALRELSRAGIPVRKALAELAMAQQIDIAIERDGLQRRSKRLICFDVDSTLITGEVIEMLAAHAGQGAAAAQRYAQLPPRRREQLLAFLMSLTAPEPAPAP